MSAVDFGEWAAPDLVLTYGGRTYTVRPPTVDDAKKILACAVRGELELGLVKGDLPEGLQEILDSIGESHPALGAVYDQLYADKVPAQTIDRMAYYAVFYWARGKKYADSLATILFTPRVLGANVADGGDAPRKGS